MSATATTTPSKPLSLWRRCPREYEVWATMKQRCLNSRCREYKHYGGRGIGVCRRWVRPDGFHYFLADLGPRPKSDAGLHRTNNDGGYEPGNFVWADAKTQARNMRSNRILAHGRESKTLVEWAEEKGIKPGTLGARLAKGWSVAQALTRPVDPRRPFAQWKPQTP